MSNTFFHFKQFTIFQERCAMKVGTDGVLLGSWVNINGTKQILDIGTGTGLIALMLAQRSNSNIDAIEIDTDAASEALGNVIKSKWQERIKVHAIALQNFSPEDTHYDLIVTNPPYFSNSLPAPDPSRNIARHDHQLSLPELLSAVARLLNPEGRLGIILPTEIFEEFTALALAAKLYPIRKLLVKPSPSKSVNRILAEFAFVKEELRISEIIIEKYGRQKYSEEYIHLTREFYLNL
jgi:tRNA1Val (adenine37-N6)-methyltransferase